ncbi:arginine--tRNA ligase [Thermoproteota archaeon]
MIKAELSQHVEQVLAQAGISIDSPIRFEQPNNKEFGDFATNAPFLYAPKLKKSPLSIADEWTALLNQDPWIKKELVLNPVNGFINVSFKDEYLWDTYTKLFDKAHKTYPKQDNKILLEFVCANPTGPLHIGHGRWAVLGSILTSLMRFTGMQVSTEFYINDAGNQVERFYESVSAVKSGTPIPEDGYHGSYIQELAKSDSDPLQLVLEQQKQTLSRIGVEFDNWYSEKRLHQENKVKKAVTLLKKKGFTYEKEGALWFKSQELGDEKDRVLIKSDSQPTYFIVDLAYHQDKIKRGFDRLINIWGADHHGYVKRVKCGLSALTGQDYQADERFKIMLGQLVSLTRAGEPVKMSKRSGELITLDEVIDEIGSDAVRFFLINKSPDTHIEFDLELAKKKSNENPVYYIQYAHARICSILKKLKEEGILKQDHRLTLSKTDKLLDSDISNLKLTQTERSLLRHSIMLYDEILDCAKSLSPHKLTHYMITLAKLFHLFYEHCPILKAEKDVQIKRIVILKQLKKILALCLRLLGISAPQRM